MKFKNFKPLITIYITNHNYGKYLNQSIKSVLNQTYDNYELIIIDDGSTDGSREIINKYIKFENIKVIYQKNKGLIVSNNIALKLARGEYITRLDADDWLDENFLQVMVDELKKDPKTGMIFCNYYLVNKRGQIQNQFLRHNFNKVKLLDQPAHGACSLINLKCLKLVGGYNEKFKSQDGVDIWIKLIFKYKIRNINLPLFYYRIHGKNLTSNKIKLFQTRDRVLAENANKRKKKIKKTICIIPIRGKNENSIALEKIEKETILSRVINELLATKLIKKIIVSTPDKIILNYIKKKFSRKILTHKRNEKLAGYNISIDETLRKILSQYKKKISMDSILKVNVDHPLLNRNNFSSIINLMNIYDTDEVIAVKRENDNFFYHNGNSLKPFTQFRNLTLEREEVYRQIGSLHLINIKSLTKKIKTKKIGHIILDDISSYRVKSDVDLQVCKFLLRKFNSEKF